MQSMRRRFVFEVLAALAVGTTLRVPADQVVYSDSLQNSWENWSWATVNLNNSSPTHLGSRSISVNATDWQALYLHCPAQNGSAFTNLTFWVHGGTAGGQLIQVAAMRSGDPQTGVNLAPLPANDWRQESVSLAALGVAAAQDFDGFWLQIRTASTVPVFYVDDIALVSGSTPPVTNSPMAVLVDAQRNRHPISPLIYGMAFASSNQLRELNCPLNRSGGNAETRYNWELNAHNRGGDWYFESLADSPATPGAEADEFVGASKGAGAEAMITVPMIGWAPKLGPGRGRLSSFSIAKYGPQTDSDWQWFPDAGNGVSATNNNRITWNDPNDANFPTNAEFQRGYVRHLVGRWGASTNGGVGYYLMDNEHTLWHETHRDVQKVGATMQEVRDRFFEYAAMVKSEDPTSLVAAPEEWGWTGYLYSGYDSWWAGQNGWNISQLPDRKANGGMDYMPWFLDQCRQRAETSGQRLLDLFTLHFYPQNNEFSQDVSSTVQLRRNRTTRSLWDPAYVDPSWINAVVQLIPRMKNWVAARYPGTKIGITEYNWGAEGHINGATTQADILGIFGREGLDLATRWVVPDSDSPTFKAMKLFRNYDGNRSGFGDLSVSASGPNPDDLAVFAAVRSTDAALTVMSINKQLTATATPVVTLTNFVPAGTAQVWQLTAANAITRLPDIAFAGSVFSNTVPAQSITLYVIPQGTATAAVFSAARNGALVDLLVEGAAGSAQVIYQANGLTGWTPLATNTLPASGRWTLPVPATNSARFFRVGSAP